MWKVPYKKGDRPVESNGKPHNCPKFKGGGNKSVQKTIQYKIASKLDYERCPYCKGTNGGYCRKNTTQMENHIKTFHPNGEILYDDDLETERRKKVHRPCVYCGIFFFYEYVLLKDNDPINYVCDECSHK